MNNNIISNSEECKDNEYGNLKEREIDVEPYVVCIGASAGGLDAINNFFDNIYENTGLAFVVIQHLSPDHKSLMRELLSRHTSMNVFMAEHEMEIMADSVYLIPPGKNMTIKGNKLYLLERDVSKGFSLPIDIFFEALSRAKKEKAVGIILSGSGSDGSEGVKSIKANGGLVLVQDNKSAQFVSMPQSVIATGAFDYILEPAQMPEEIMKYVKSEEDGSEKVDISNYNEEVYIKILNSIKEYTNVDFFHYKRGTVLRRLERRMGIYGFHNIADYLNYINSNPHEITTLYKEFFIGVTQFFRDSEAFGIIEKEVIPKIFEKKSPGSTIRIWVAGCSVGPEAYTIAILIKEYLNKADKSYNVKIFATDIDEDALSVASTGVYPSDIEDNVSSERLRNFFIKIGDKYQVNKNIRDMVIFAKHNLIKDPPFSKLDLITCRNLLIYLQHQIQQNILSYFHFALNKNGYLFLGSSEAIGESEKFFSAVNSKWKIYSCSGDTKLPRVANFNINKIGKYVHERNSGLLGYNYSRISNYLEKSIERFMKQLQEEYIPRGLIIDESYELLHVIGDVNNYIRIPSNKLSLNILKMIRSDLSIAVSTAVHNVLREGKELKYKNIQLKNPNGYVDLTLTVKPFSDETTHKKFAAILFEEQKISEASIDNEEEFEIHSKTYQRITDLEQELKYSNENLQAVIEELESSNEELQATNEELLASNEELQSTNEELQSVNEELYTVNSEYQLKIQELTEAHDDINNLLSITNVNTIFLDKDLCIRRFTPAVRSQVNIISSDIGRPISHISWNLKYDELLYDIHDVLKTLESKEKEITGLDDKWYSISISPYFAGNSKIKGILINIRDITEMKRKDILINKLLEENKNLKRE
ncbi:CheR family methyltransferase [Clostridium beijerinckii]|uniref:Chemotaxis protein n=1 Tax=Clostridium beijerinckii TaxID=1520 RepID=A0A7X9STM4_CLOBE|nr:CheR family methyltransferase [Clostridium beijerinckii]NMF07750.1 chemotaxis protein [Clostridium beijerinckii]